MVTMPAHRWFAMIKSRFWSNFAGFSDAQLQEGVDELHATLGLGEGREDAAVTFPDRILFIVAEKY